MAITEDDVTPGELQPINETPEWVEHLPALESGVKLRAGADRLGAMNFQARVLDSRTRYLLAMVMGLTSQGVILKGYLENEAELNAIETEGLQVGTAYFVDYALRAWNGTEWASSGSLQGNRGITLLGSWPDHLALPAVAEYKLGDTFTWNHDLHILVPGDEDADPNKWEALNLRGKDGKSTYESWKEIPGNENGSVNDFMLAQKGVAGDDAPTAWFKRPGNEGLTMADYDAYYKGLKGDTGEARAAFVVAGTKATSGDLPLPGDETKAWYVGIDLYVWVEETTNYVMIPGIGGKSAFEIWVSKPANVGKTEDDFFEAYRGRPGLDSQVAGPPGTDGRNLRVLGTRPTSADIIAIEEPTDQDAYCALDTGRLWMYLPLEGGWKDLGPWRGVDGKNAFELWLEDGHEGSSMQDFWNFFRGQDGRSMDITGIVATLGGLPENPTEQMIYGVRDESTLYIFLDSAWAPMGSFGRDGKSAYELWQEDGHPGGTLEQFWADTKGKDGVNLDYIKILTNEDPTPPDPDEANKGKAYISLDRYVFVNITGGAWENAGPFQPPGERGYDGKMWTPKGMVATNADLPPGADVEEGWGYQVIETGLFHVFDGENWAAGIDLVSKEPGPEGQQGAPGALMPIKAVYVSLAALQAAHPTGTLGDAYLLIPADKSSRNLAIWDANTTTWIDTGPAGIPGAEGKPGKDSTVPGPPGPQGSRWINLDTFDAPSNNFVGREGDWCINLANRIYYKAPTGWVFWNILVKGDVNSPLEAEGRVVRYGTTWVPVPVDEVVAAVAGKIYGRRKVGDTDKTEWVPLPDYVVDLAVKDDKQYCRVFKADGTVPVWQEIQFPAQAGIADQEGALEGELWLRDSFAKAWVKYVKAPSDGKVYVQKNGNFISLDRMDYPIITVSATANFDPTTNQVLKVTNTAATAKTITLADGPKSVPRAMLVPVIVVGQAGAVTFAAASGTTLSWHKATVPTIQNALTILSFFWTGDQWVGASGYEVP